MELTMRRWRLVLAGILGCTLGAGAVFVFPKNGAVPAPLQIAAAKAEADRKTEPDLSVLQATYDFELQSGNPAHDVNLKILKANCLKGQETSYVCFVSFFSTADPDVRIYNGVTQIAYTEGGWFLQEGLCKRHDGPYGS
jgi:hypothetical protein